MFKLYLEENKIIFNEKMMRSALYYSASVSHNIVLWKCVRLHLFQMKNPNNFIPSSDFIIENNCNRGQYFTADTI